MTQATQQKLPGIEDNPTLISVLIVNYNAGAWLQRCVDALAGQSHGNFEALILDNASTDGSVESLTLPDKRFAIHKFGKNLGFAAANNAGARMAKGDWLATLNPDAFPESDWLLELLNATNRYPGTVMFGSTQWLHDHPGILDGVGDCLPIWGMAWRGGHRHRCDDLPPEGEVFSPCAAAAFYKADVFKDVGGFCEPFFCFNEDVDLGFRLRLRGHRAIQASKAVVAHASGGSNTTGEFASYHGHRNAIWVNIINMPLPLLLLSLPAHLLAEALLLLIKLPGLLPAEHRSERATVWRAMARGVVHGIVHSAWARQARRHVQKNRIASPLAVAGALCWSPWRFLKKAPYIRKML